MKQIWVGIKKLFPYNIMFKKVKLHISITMFILWSTSIVTKGKTGLWLETME